jgi:staphylococcal nuclease domain-containing protein 1
VEFIANGSRFKVYIAKENAKITLVLAGIRCPRVARSDKDASEPFGAEALAFVTERCLQRDVSARRGSFAGSSGSDLK